MIHMTLDLKPEAKQRPRFNRTTGRAYTAEKTRKFENAVKALAKEHISEPLNGAVSLSIVFVAPRLKAEPKSQTERKYKTSRPDLSNMIKSLEDGLQGALFHDDAQVVKLSAEKVYAGLGESPHIEITASVIPVLFSADESEQSRQSRQSVQSSADERARSREEKRIRREANRKEHRVKQRLRDEKLSRDRGVQKLKVARLGLNQQRDEEEARLARYRAIRDKH